jgi:hypothetical protein
VSPKSRRSRGELQNIANQIAQLVVGWQVVNDGAIFDGQPSSGEIVINIGDGSASINGTPVSMGIAKHAHLWLLGEVERQAWGDGWYDELIVCLKYQTASPQTFPQFRISDAGLKMSPIGLRLTSDVLLRVGGEKFTSQNENTQVAYPG